MHYVAFLLDQGRHSYREIWDINFPGAYLPNWVVQRCFGPSSLAWRVYDLLLLLLMGLAMWALSGPRRWFPALWASGLFAVIHGRDGMEQLGQRDLTATVLLIVAVFLLQREQKKHVVWAFGVAVGAATTIKPVFALFLVLLAIVPVTGQKERLRLILSALSGWLLPVSICLLWLWLYGSLHAFWFTLTVLLPYHAGLGHVSLASLILKSVSPLAPLFVVWIGLLLVDYIFYPVTSSHSSQRRILACAAGLGWLCFLLQGKAYPYQRYPFLAFVLLLIAVDFAGWSRTNKRPFQLLSTIALLWGSCFLAPRSAWKVSQYDWRSDEFGRELTATVQANGVAVQPQAGQPISVVCLDTVSGCLSVLENMQIAQTTPNLYDEFLFGEATKPAITVTRTRFLQGLYDRPPDLVVVTSRMFPDGPDDYRKLLTWPALQYWLDTNYSLVSDWHPSSKERWMGRCVTPASFRVYRLHPHTNYLRSMTR